MQRYHASSCNSAVNNSTIGGPSARDGTRNESSSTPSNFTLNSRRPSQITPYKIKCEKEPLNSRLGPPDFHTPTPNCPEETLTKEYVQTGYKETVEGLEEAREISLSQVQIFTKAVILKCREEGRRYYRSINESRSQKRKAGQVYDVPLSGTLLSKSGTFPEQRPCGEEFRKKWIESLSQQHKRLCSLADHVPHGYRRRSLFEVLIRNNVPLLRATWFIKVTYLNQVRPGSSSISSGLPDKTQFSRSEQWTKDVIDYLQSLLDEFASRNNSHSTVNTRDRSPQMAYSGSMQNKNDSASAGVDSEEPSLYLKWWYVVRILQWHHAEGLLIPSLVIDWVLNQLQEKELLGVLQLLLPIIYGVIETIVLSQTYVRTLVGIAGRFIRESSPGGSDLVENSRRAYTISALVEMLRYLILAVPDTFVALDCFPLPSSVVTHGVNGGNFMSKVADSARNNNNNGPLNVASVLRDKGLEVMSEGVPIDRVVSSIQKCSETLARGTRPGNPGQNMAKTLQELDNTLSHGDVRVAYKCLFENLSDGAVDEHWIAEVSSCLSSSLKYIGTVSPSFVSSVFFICEWATCDFRDFRTSPPHGLKFTGRKDLSQIHIAMRLLKLKMRDIQTSFWNRDDSIPGNLAKDTDSLNDYAGRTSGRKGFDDLNSKNVELNLKTSSDVLESPGPLHDTIVCWIDQHEVQNGEGFKRLQLLIVELIRAGILYPQAYVRQLIVSGIMDMNGSSVDQVRRKRHYRILKQLPGPYVREAFEEAQIADPQVVSEAITVYSNERRLVLNRLLDQHGNSSFVNSSYHKKKHRRSSADDIASPSSVDEWKFFRSVSGVSARTVKRSVELEDIKASISFLLQLPGSSSSTGSGIGESPGSVKKSAGSSGSKMDLGEGSPACEECRRAKRQKLSEERSSYSQGNVPNPTDEEDFWWTRKGPKSMESFKPDPPPKPAKQASRGRQKVGRKTQSLAQLAASRIEGSQGASTSHVCDIRTSCPHHRTGAEGDVPKSADGIRATDCADIVSIGKVLKKMRFVEKRTTVVWLIAVVKQLVEEGEKVSSVPKVGQYGRPSTTVDDRSSLRWKLGEDELSAILYLMDISDELVLAVKFLLWLLPKALSYPGSTIHGGRNVLMLPRNVENIPCEGFLLSSMRRYETIVVAADLLPETLSATMGRAAATMVPNGRVHGSPALIYARHILKKYGYVASVVEWEKRFKLTCDKRLVSELESGRLLDAEFGYPLGVPAGVEDLDDFFRQKISGVRLSRVGQNMRDIVKGHVGEAFPYNSGKERKSFGTSSVRSQSSGNSDDGYQIAQQTVMGLMECMRQTGGAAQEGDPNLVSSAISAIICNVGQFMAKIPELTVSSNQLNLPSTSGSLNLARRILRIHLTCLYLLKEALGERQSRVFEVALASESSSVLVQIFSPGKGSRSQFQLSPESQDSNTNLSNDITNNSTRPLLGKAARIAAAVSALVIGAILHGITSLERMVTLFRLREGVDFIHFIRNMRSNSNGNARSMGAFKVDNLVEVSVHWFRVLVGNCRTVADGFIVDLLGEPAVVALSRMQRTLPLNLVFPPAYSIFAFILWRPFIQNSIGTRDDHDQLYQSLALAIGDALKHLPFREVCLRDTHGLHDLLVVDAVDNEFASMLEVNGLDKHQKATAFVPIRARLFLNALVDCKMSQPMLKLDEGNRMSGHVKSKFHRAANDKIYLDKLVHVIDTLQPAKFHWQWVELRLLLNEQALAEKLEADTSLVEAMQYISSNPEKTAASDNESNFIEVLLTRLLARPDAASLFSEVVHLLGRSLDDSMLLQVKWFLGGQDVLYGRKSIRQRLINIAEGKGLSTKGKHWKPWGWCYSTSDSATSKGNKRKFEVSSLEEGEVVDEGPDLKRARKESTSGVDVEGFAVCQQVTERALVELVLPCVDKGSDDSRNTFAIDMIKQMSNIEQQINAATRGTSKAAGTATSGIESPASKGTGRKGIKSGTPASARRPTVSVAETVPPLPAALRASMSLRLQFLLRLLPIICSDGEPSSRNMRHMLASVILRLLGSRVVHEDACHSFSLFRNSITREADPFSTASVHLSGESLFDHLLLVLHGLLSSSQPRWLQLKSRSRSSSGGSKDFSVFDREVVESLQNDLDHMHLPEAVRWRIQTAMPILSPSVRCLISCQYPSVSPAALAALQSSNPISVLQTSNSNLLPQRNITRSTSSMTNKPKPLPVQQELDLEIDPWTLLEDGAGSGQSSGVSTIVGGSDNANPRASNWLKGAVRVRRKDLTYIGAVDEES